MYTKRHNILMWPRVAGSKTLEPSATEIGDTKEQVLQTDASEARGVVQDGSLIDLLGLETLLGGDQEGAKEVETTEQTIAVKTSASLPSDDPVDGTVGTSGNAWEQPGSTSASGGTVEQASSVSATLSTESLLVEQRKPIMLTTSSSADKEDKASVTSSSPGSSSSTAPVISASSSQQMSSSIVATPSLPRHHMTTTQAAELVITTTELNDEELNAWQEVPHTHSHLTDYDYRAKYPMTDYTVEASKPIVKMERTEPSYDKENPNRVGLADGEIDPDLDHFLSREAPLKSGGPLNTTGRSKADEAQNRMDVVGNDDLQKSDRRAEPGPDINDILSGLLNVVGEGLHFATNYVKENNKKKLQEKLDAELAEEESKNVVPEKGVNRTRVNNRGPPLGDLKDPQTFEAVPLRPPPGVKPGAKPVAIPQRPFR